MPDDFEIETDEDGNEYVRIPKDQAFNQRDLARKAKDLEPAAAEGEKAKRELAFLKAGVNADESKIAALFVKSYDGELTTDAIKAAFADLGVTEKPAVEGEQQLTPEQQAAADAEAKQTEERAALARGSAGFQDTPPRDPRELSAEAVAKARAEGRTEEVALSNGLRELVNAAVAGDKRVRIGASED